MERFWLRRTQKYREINGKSTLGVFIFYHYLSGHVRNKVYRSEVRFT